eukprot:scaffold46054_cov54-Phaeocystis_antarctica.AAC.3
MTIPWKTHRARLLAQKSRPPLAAVASARTMTAAVEATSAACAPGRGSGRRVHMEGEEPCCAAASPSHRSSSGSHGTAPSRQTQAVCSRTAAIAKWRPLM